MPRAPGSHVWMCAPTGWLGWYALANWARCGSAEPRFNSVGMPSQGIIDSIVARVFGKDALDPPPGMRDALRASSNVMEWSMMKCHKSKYRGFQARCCKCGALAWVAWTPTPTNGWRDHQRTNMCSFLGMPVPGTYRAPLEAELHMV